MGVVYNVKFLVHYVIHFHFLLKYDFLVSVKAVPLECVIRTGQP